MTKRDVITVAFMIAGIHVWTAGLQILAYLPTALGFARGDPSSLFDNGFGPFGVLLVSLALVATVIFCVGYVLFFRAAALALRVFPEGDGDGPPVPWGTQNVEAIAISVVGLVLAAWALPGLLYKLLAIILPTALTVNSHAGPGLGWLLWSCVEPLLKVLIGGALFFKASALAEYWRQSQEPIDQGQGQ